MKKKKRKKNLVGKLMNQSNAVSVNGPTYILHWTSSNPLEISTFGYKML